MSRLLEDLLLVQTRPWSQGASVWQVGSAVMLRHKMNKPWLFPYSVYYLRYCPLCHRDYIFTVWPFDPDPKGHPAPEVRKYR